MQYDDKNREIFDQKADAATFAHALERHFNWFSGVPDSVFQKVLPALRHWQFAPRENSAVAMAFGARLGGLRPCVLIQNSGLGLSIDALLGTFHLYNTGLLLVVSNRGALSWEEVQHQYWGKITRRLLAAAGIPQVSFDTEGLDGIERAAALAVETNKITCLLVDRGNINE